MKTAHIVVRHQTDISPCWQYYGADVPMVGGSDTLAAAKNMATEALEDFSADEVVTAVFHVERQALAETDDHPAVYVRALQDADCNKRLRRQDLSMEYVEYLRQDPGKKQTFGGLVAATGDVVAVAVFPDDLLCDALQNVGPYDTMFFGMPDGPHVYWQSVSGELAEELPRDARPIESTGVHRNSTVRDLMMKTGRMDLGDVSPLKAQSLAAI